MPTTSTTNSPSIPDSHFTPRPEFIRSEHKPIPNSFALLAISGPNCIRLYSFSPSTTTTLRRFLEQRKILQGTREDVHNNLYEFALDGKPWSSPKSLATERFLVEFLTVIYSCGYTFLSSVDYGRESDDRLAITFSIPKPSPDSRSTFADKQVPVPWALSFPSATTLRVIHPPLHSTPAILQAVRSAWPRGVDSEKKVGDNCFEFKLKGYKWFQEDTFAVDSLRHILSLLASLDAHSFTLQTSISLTNRSRVKDLWIFVGTAPRPDNASSPSLQMRTSPEPTVAHRRQMTEPLQVLPHSQLSLQQGHHRAATDQRPQTPQRPHTPNAPSPLSPRSQTPPSVLRKAAPRAQVPISVHDEVDGEGMGMGEGEYRAVLPSVISEGVQDMTGVGVGVGRTPDVFYEAQPFAGAMTFPLAVSHPIPRTPTPQSQSRGASPVPIQAHSRGPSPSPYPEPQGPEEDLNHRETGTLLSPGTFKATDSSIRSSAFSDGDPETRTIPIEWTGVSSPTSPRPETNRMSSVPKLPGGWRSTPTDEKDSGIEVEESPGTKTPVHDANIRVANPEITEQGRVKSEVGEMGVIPVPGTPPPLPVRQEIVAPPHPPPVHPSRIERSEDKDKGKERNTSASSGQGWVLVNVGSPAPLSSSTSPVPQGEPSSSSSAETDPHDTNVLKKPMSGNASMSPAAKAIVIIDAVDAKKDKKTQDVSKGKVKRFFSLSRAQRDSDGVKERARSKSSAGLSERLKRLGTPEVTRREGGDRRSFD
ncbi:hypothetical protein Moror_1970 [Moniliophthora roreri MCA 2997]|uniref:Uncharacterized protein n=2 Tax=Moniliophthora roreri TaxID=221103 RepID=V2X171_MONRO|nr:hypothetical protein Moror_1970 [Moniliophthora roreri MCA 2997]KAI3597870.1 hypothetical protein WG66_012512 [Moniliophthora roreri]